MTAGAGFDGPRGARPAPLVCPGLPALDAPQGEVAPGGLGFLLGVAHRQRRRAWELDLADLGLSAPQAALLRLVVARPGSGVRQLARWLGTDVMNVKRLAGTLIAVGLCEAQRDPADARRRPLHPTQEGSRIAERIAERAGLAERSLAAALGDECYEELLCGLRALVDHDVDHLRTPTT